MNIQEFRQKYPQYQDISDKKLAKSLHSKYYSDMDFNAFSSKFLGKSESIPTVPKPNSSFGFGSTAASVGRGFLQGVENAAGGLSQTVSAGLEKLGIMPSGSTEAMTERIRADREAFSNSPAGQATAGKIGRFVGEIAPWMLIPGGAVGAGIRGIVGAGIRGGLLGGGIAGLQYTDVKPNNNQGFLSSLFQQKAENLKRGAGFGAGVGALFGAPFAIANRINKGLVNRMSSNPSTQSAIESGTRHNVPVFTSDVSSPTINKTGELLEYLPLGMVRKRLAQNKSARLSADKLSDSYQKEMMATQFAGKTGLKRLKAVAHSGGARANTAKELLNDIKNAGDDWNQIIQTSGNVRLFRSKVIADRKFDKVRQLADEAGEFSVQDKSGSISAIKQSIKEAVESPIPKKDISSRLKEIKSYLEQPNLNYSKMMAASSDVRDLIDSAYKGANAAVGKKGVGLLQRVKEAIDQDLERFSLTHGDRLRNAQQNASKFYRQNVVPAKNSQIAKLIKTERPDEIYKQFIKSSTREDGRGRGAALQFYNALDDKGKAAVRYGMVSEALNKATTRVKSSQDIVLSPAKFANTLENVAAAKSVFFKGTARNEIDGFINLMRTIQRSGQVAENPPTGHRLLQALAASGGIGLGVVSPTAAIPAAGTLYGLQRLLTTDAGRRLLLAASKTPPGSKAAHKLVNRVVSFIRSTAAVQAAE